MNKQFLKTEDDQLHEMRKPQTSAEMKYQILTFAKCSDRAAWAPLLAGLIKEKTPERLRALALIRLRTMAKYKDAAALLIHLAEDPLEEHRIRMLATEGLRFFSGKNVSEALIGLAQESGHDGLQRIALSSLKQVDPKCYESLVSQPGAGASLVEIAKDLQDEQPREESPLTAGKEKALRSRMGKPGGKAAFNSIRKLQKAREAATVTALMDRFGEENEKNKAEIMLTLAKIGRANSQVSATVEKFLRQCAKGPKKLQDPAKLCLEYLTAADPQKSTISASYLRRTVHRLFWLTRLQFS